MGTSLGIEAHRTQSDGHRVNQIYGLVGAYQVPPLNLPLALWFSGLETLDAHPPPGHAPPTGEQSTRLSHLPTRDYLSTQHPGCLGHWNSLPFTDLPPTSIFRQVYSATNVDTPRPKG